MWVFALFDLPVYDKQARKKYTQFRKHLLRRGFTMLQFSVYARYCASEDRAAILRQSIRFAVPTEGHVRVLSITDRQFGKMEIYRGKMATEPEKPPEQLSLF